MNFLSEWRFPLTLESALLAAMTLNGPTFCLKSHFLPKKIDFPKVRYKIVQYFNSVYAHKPKFGFLFCFLSFLPFKCVLFLFLSKTK